MQRGSVAVYVRRPTPEGGIEMKKRVFPTAAAVVIWPTALLVLLCLLGRASPGVFSPALAAPSQITPTVTLVDPSSAPNDLDAPIVITGTDFVSTPVVHLGDTSLNDVSWVSTTRLEAAVPWGMDPGVYTVTVINPDKQSGSLVDAFTVTHAIGVWNAGALYGGEIRDIAINPDNPETLYAASENVGLFRSRDGGENWSFVYAPRARHVAIDPITPTTIYWGKGGLYRSDDEGDTWIALDTEGEVPYAHPTISGTVYASKQWDGGGLWKSTNYGQTWVTMTNGLTDTQVAALVFHPTDPMTMVVGTTNGNLFRSTDGGDLWTHASKPVELVSALAFNRWGAQELWVSDCCFCVPQATLKSTNVDYTDWITVGEPVGSAPLTSIAFPPPLGWGDAYSRTVYAAGCWDDAYKTTDGGNTWQDWGPGTGGWGWSIALDPQTPGVTYKASLRDGVYKTTDEGDTWRVVNQGLTAMVPSQLATVPDQPDVVYAVAEGWEGVLKGKRGGESWQFLECDGADEGPDGSMLVDPFTPGRLYRSGNQEVYRSDDGGLSWPISDTLDPPDVCTVNVQGILPGVLRADPQQPGTLLAGTNVICNDFDTLVGDIYRSTDHGITWTTTLTPSQVISQVTDLAYDTMTPTIVYAATEGTGMLRSTDSGQSWQRMGEGIAALDDVRSIAVEPVAPYRVFAQAEHPYSGLYVSENHGLSWTLATSWLWSEQILCTDEDPSVLYAAMTGGLLRSTDGAQSWSRAAGALGYVPIYSLATVTATDRVILYAGTTGGYVESGGAQALSLVNNDGTLVNAGVYRYTTRRTWALYLPLVFKAYTP